MTSPEVREGSEPKPQMVEPVPLRSITTLINYERMISDPRYKGLKLGGSTRCDPNMSEGIKKLIPRIWDGEAESVTRRSVHMFAADIDTGPAPATDEVYPPATCLIHPFATSGVKALVLRECDLIFHETRGHDGCYNATGMYQEFFALCPEGQLVSIQIADEEPILVDVGARMVFEYTLHAPKHDIRCVLPGSPPNLGSTPTEAQVPASGEYWYTASGSTDGENHCVMAFLPEPHTTTAARENYIVVDMTRLQYGEKGLGTYNEPYFLGPYRTHLTSMSGICGELQFRDMVRVTLGRVNDADNQARVKQCARRAWERWQNRATEGWCEYCGRGGSALKRCTGCKEKKVWFCCQVHNKMGWKLHKLTCESQVGKPHVFGPEKPKNIS